MPKTVLIKIARVIRFFDVFRSHRLEESNLELFKLAYALFLWGKL